MDIIARCEIFVLLFTPSHIFMVFGRLILVILPVAISVVVGLVVGLVIGYRRIDADWFFNQEIFLFFLGGRPLGAIFANFFVKQRLVRIVGFCRMGIR